MEVGFSGSKSKTKLQAYFYLTELQSPLCLFGGKIRTADFRETKFDAG